MSITEQALWRILDVARTANDTALSDIAGLAIQALEDAEANRRPIVSHVGADVALRCVWDRIRH